MVAPLPTLSSITSSLTTTTTKPPIFTARLPHLALGHQRYKSVQALRPHLLPSTSSLIINHNNHHIPNNIKPFLNLRNHSAACTHHHHHKGSDITATLATHDIYTSPHTNTMGIEIPTEQWAQVCKQVGGRKFDLIQQQLASPPHESAPALCAVLQHTIPLPTLQKKSKNPRLTHNLQLLSTRRSLFPSPAPMRSWSTSSSLVCATPTCTP